jgi:DNA-binding NarL/FixJ family response regulator
MSDEARPDETATDVLEELTPRQRAVIALASTGLSAPDIAQRLALTQDSVRKDLSKAYRVLVPGDEGGDLRTRAVLAYLRIMRDQEWDDAR